MLEGQTAIVTGSGRGIGSATALKLAGMGANIVINYRKSMESALNLKSKIEEFGVRAFLVQGDISKTSDAQKIIESAFNEFKSVDILVNNAGITRDNLIIRMSDEDFDDVIATNLKGAFNCIRYASKIMLKQKRGRIINIASIVGEVGNAGQANYASAKAGIIGLTKSIAKELGSRGITCNAVAPGFIETDMTKNLSDKLKAEMLKEVPLRREGKPEDVANLIGFLASNEASYITGQVINCDGGMVM